MKKTRIMHLTFNMGIGGTEQVIRQLVTNLPPEQFDNQVVCIDGFVGEVGLLLEQAGIPVSAIKRRPGVDWSLVRRIRKRIVSGQVDVVHCHQYTPWFYGWLATRMTGIPVVFTEHGRFHPDRYRYKAIFLNQIMARSTNAVVAISEATRNALARYEFMPKSRIQVIYNGIRGLCRDEARVKAVRQELGIPDHGFVLGTVARLDPVKNQRMMLKGFSWILEAYPDSWMLLVGDGPDRAMLEDYAVTLGIDARVRFTGFKEEPVDYMAAMNLFLLTSHTEGTSMTLLEAMSLGIPTIATAVGGSTEVIEPGVNGVLIPSDSPEDLVRVVDHLRKDPQCARILQSGAGTTFERRFSVDRMVSGYRNLYQRLPGRPV